MVDGRTAAYASRLLDLHHEPAASGTSLRPLHQCVAGRFIPLRAKHNRTGVREVNLIPVSNQLTTYFLVDTAGEWRVLDTLEVNTSDHPRPAEYAKACWADFLDLNPTFRVAMLLGKQEPVKRGSVQ